MKKVIIASVCSNLDLFLLGLLRNPGVMPGFGCEINKQMCLIHQANYKYPNGEPVLQFIEVTNEYYNEHYVAPSDSTEKVKRQFAAKRKLQVLTVDDKRYRSRGIQEITGYEIRAAIEKHYGKDVIIILVGGPPCQDSSRLSRSNKGRNGLILEFLRILNEGNFDAALMEEIPQIRTSEPKVWAAYEKYASSMQYQWGRKDVDAINYEGYSSRPRMICQFVNKKYNRQPVFPIPMPELAKRAGEVIKCERWHSGHFDDRIRTKYDYFTTVTRSSPRTIWELDEVNTALSGKQVLLERSGTVADKQKLMGQKEGELVIPKSIPESELHLAYGNGVPVALAYHLGKTLLEKVFCVKHIGDGWFVPLDDNNNIPAPNGDISQVSISNINGTIDAKEPATPSVPQIAQPVAVNNINNNILTEPTNRQEEYSKQITHPLPNIEVIHPTPNQKINGPAFKPTKKIISSEELLSMEFDTLGFTGRWNAFFGNPSIIFNAIIHGFAGDGKSTLAVQFAKYLADNHGRTLYLSGEEGFSKTLKDKVVLTNSSSHSLHWAELKSSLEILREVRPNAYRFIFIDSLQHLNVNAGQMRELRGKYKNTSFICISQVTKAGEMRGSNELAHDSDIIVKVEKGLATTTKNRFKEKGTTFNVFESIVHPEEEMAENKVGAENPTNDLSN